MNYIRSYLRIKDSGIRKGLLLYRDAYTEWLDKGNDEADLIKVVKQSGDMLIHNAIENNYMIKAMHQFNLKWSLLEYFQESEGTMKNKLRSREIMLLVFQQGMKYQEVAKQLNISLSTVKNLVAKSVEKLRERLNDEALIYFFIFFQKD